MGDKKIKLTLTLLLTGLMLNSSTVFASSHDAGWTFGDVGFLSYKLDSVEPSDDDLGAAVGSENPTLTLQLGRRYQVTIVNYQVHPFEVLAKGPSAGLDTALLSMGSPVGPFESDPAVAWEDNNSGTVTFTLTYSLYKAMSVPGKAPGYRCRPHSTTMRGDFIVQGVPVDGPIEKGQIGIELEEIASDLTAPVDIKQAPGDNSRLFVLDQAGEVHLIVDGVLQSEPFIDVTDRLVSLGIFGTQDEGDFDERGFLGLAFHPGFADPNSAGFQKVYTYTSEPVSGPADFTTDPVLDEYNHQSVVAEWLIDADDPNSVDIASRREILRINEPQFNHDGGTLAFGPDGYLYIALGDGGGANDTSPGHGPTGNGQNFNTIYGSLVRIDPLEPSITPDSNNPVSVNGNYRVPADNPFVGTDGLDEIFAYGLRNPFKFSFDSETGLLVVGDVGQGNIEEIDIIEKGGNYGWNIKEGTFRFNPQTGGISDDLSGIDPALIDPVAEYDHDDGISIIGGFVYRGSAIPELVGKYVFGDFSGSFGAPTGRLFYAELETGLIKELIIGTDDRDLNLYVKGFGADSDGEIYVLGGTSLGPFGNSGVVLKIVPGQ